MKNKYQSRLSLLKPFHHYSSRKHGGAYISDERKKIGTSDPVETSGQTVMFVRTITGNPRSWIASILMTFLLSLFDRPSYLKAQNLTEGSVCSVGNWTGVCKPLWDCPTPYQNGYPSTSTCRFVNTKPIICCPSLTDTTINSATVVPSSSNRDDVGSKARAKCEEYSRHVYEAELLPLLTSKPAFINKSLCAIDKKLMNKLKPTRLKRIAGGIQAEPKEFPHMAAIGHGDSIENAKWLCGGTIISERFVLTAAECLPIRYDGESTWVRVGDLNLEQSDDDARPQDLRVIEKIPHPEYKDSSRYNNIGLLKLEEDVMFNAWVRPICLPYSFPDIGSNTKAIVTGWGSADLFEQRSSNLQEVTVNFIPNQQCNTEYTTDIENGSLKFGIMEDQQICAGTLGRDTCQGDSGGPLVVLNNDYYCMYSLIGITSFGMICGVSPTVYTRVYYYLSWIEDTVWPNL